MNGQPKADEGIKSIHCHLSNLNNSFPELMSLKEPLIMFVRFQIAYGRPRAGLDKPSLLEGLMKLL